MAPVILAIALSKFLPILSHMSMSFICKRILFKALFYSHAKNADYMLITNAGEGCQPLTHKQRNRWGPSISKRVTLSIRFMDS